MTLIGHAYALHVCNRVSLGSNNLIHVVVLSSDGNPYQFGFTVENGESSQLCSRMLHGRRAGFVNGLHRTWALCRLPNSNDHTLPMELAHHGNVLIYDSNAVPQGQFQKDKKMESTD